MEECAHVVFGLFFQGGWAVVRVVHAVLRVAAGRAALRCTAYSLLLRILPIKDAKDEVLALVSALVLHLVEFRIRLDDHERRRWSARRPKISILELFRGVGGCERLPLSSSLVELYSALFCYARLYYAMIRFMTCALETYLPRRHRHYHCRKS